MKQDGKLENEENNPEIIIDKDENNEFIEEPDNPSVSERIDE